MNTYFKWIDSLGHSTDYFAIRNVGNYIPTNAVRVKATAKLRVMARRGSIPTYKVVFVKNVNKTLGLL